MQEEKKYASIKEYHHANGAKIKADITKEYGIEFRNYEISCLFMSGVNPTKPSEEDIEAIMAWANEIGQFELGISRVIFKDDLMFAILKKSNKDRDQEVKEQMERLKKQAAEEEKNG